MSGYSTHRRQFNPFNLSTPDEKRGKRIKFERLPRQVKTKPLWWLLFVFAIILIIYYYLAKSLV